ncbi:MAG: hypothetical protein R3E88_20035 [Myxococcota bacterium]
MRHGRRRAALGGLAIACLFGVRASAEEARFSVVVDNEYNSNVVGRARGEIDSYLVRLGPSLELSDPYGRLTYATRYLGTYAWYANASGLDAYEQQLDVTGGYALSPRTRIDVKETFRDLRNIRFTIDESRNGADTLDGERDRFLRNTLDLRVRHAFSRRISGSIDLQNDWIDFDDDRFRNDALTMGARGGLSYQLTPADSVGVSGGFAYQSFASVRGVAGSRSRIWDAALTLEHVFDESFRVALSGGPSFVETDSDTRIAFESPSRSSGDPPEYRDINACDVQIGVGLFLASSCDSLPAGAAPASGTSIVRIALPGAEPTRNDATFFASALLSKRWQEFEVTLRYSRAQSVVSGEGGTSVRDTVRFNLDYRIDDLWNVFAGTAWTRRERLGTSVQVADVIVTASATDPGFAFPVAVLTVRRPRSAQNEQFTTVIGTTRRFSRHLSATLDFRHRLQSRESAVNDQRNVQWFIVALRLDYDFAPIRF